MNSPAELPVKLPRITPGDAVVRSDNSTVHVRCFPDKRADVLTTLSRYGCYLVVAVCHDPTEHFAEQKWCLVMGDGDKVFGWVLDFYLKPDPKFLPTAQESM
jgi:hypothetical protein